MGVITTATIPEGKTFGPIPTNLTLTDPTVLIGHMTSDNRPDVHTVKINIHDYAAGARLGEWIPYVQAARDDREQNMEAMVQNGQLYYRVIRNIHSNRELLVWYNEDLATILGVPQLNEVHDNDNGTYCCPYCAQNFHYPNSLRAHLRYKCETLRKAMHLDTSSFHPSLGLRPPYSMYGITATSPINKNLSPTGSVASATSSFGSPSPPRYNTSSPDAVSSEGDERPLKRMRCETETEDRKCSPSPSSHDQPSSIDNETRSAFRKVERYDSDGRKLSPVSSSVGFTKPHPVSTQSSISMNKNLSRDADTQPMIPPSLGPLAGRFPMMATPPFLSPLSIARMHNENLPRNFTEQRMKMGEYDHLGDKLRDIHNMENNNIYNKLSMYPDRAMTGIYPPVFKSQNPMVDKILRNPAPIPVSLSSFSLAQNWCAKCNTTFRMTSDLVYHMRSHHKREFDPLKRKREEKLRCDTCGETFKERHHLSRHMTSHVSV